MILLQRAIEACGYKTRSYSGRGMYGGNCLGVVFNGNVGELFADVIFYYLNDGYGYDAAALTALEAFRSMMTDDLGISKIAYFPSIEYDEEPRNL